MPFELGKTINQGAEWVCESSFIYETLKNPIYVALLTTTLALIIMLIFIHYYALERHLCKKHTSQGIRNVINSIHNSATLGGGYSVYPNKSTKPDNLDELNINQVVIESIPNIHN